MIILKNETKKIISVLKKDYTHLQIGPLSQVQIDEKLVRFIPSEIKKINPEDIKKTQPKKTIFEETKVEKVEVKEPVIETKVESVKDETKQEDKKTQPKRRGRKPKKETE